jgi:hypothetical protein
MWWRRALVGLALCAAPAGATKHNHSTPRPKKLLGKVSSPPSLLVWSVDLAAARVTVVVGGVDRPPDSRLFVFHDDRERNFIALDAHCKAGLHKVVCDLDYPRPYLGANVQSLTAKLHGRQVEALPAELAAAFEAARDAERQASPGVDSAGDRGATPAAVAPIDATRPPAARIAAPPPAKGGPAGSARRSPDGGALDKP